jgi:cysteine synthase A
MRPNPICIAYWPGNARSSMASPDSAARPIVQRLSAHSGALAGIGNTPLIQIDGIWTKLEYRNPSGSIKARLALYLIERAEAEGLLKPGDTIVEASSGNTGNAMSMVAAAKGYRMVVVMPQGMSPERAAISKAFGADVITIGTFHVNDALEMARTLGGKKGCFAPQQFDSEWNVDENREWLGQEILQQLPAGAIPDAFVMGVGTGGTLIGVGQAFRAVNPRARLIAVEPNESCTIQCGEVGRHSIEGISDGFVPAIFNRNRHLVDQVIAVDSDEAIAEMRQLARQYGLFVGPSSGAHIVAARRVKVGNPDLANIVTVFPDEGEKYISAYFSSPDNRNAL